MSADVIILPLRWGLTEAGNTQIAFCKVGRYSASVVNSEGEFSWWAIRRKKNRASIDMGKIVSDGYVRESNHFVLALSHAEEQIRSFASTGYGQPSTSNK
jgi:hypothetical protein